MKRFISVSTVMVLLIACITQSEATPESRAAVLFLLAKPSTRSTGMGEAYVAVYDTLAPDAASAHYNPAMIAGQTRRNLSFTHTKWLPALANDMSYNFVGYTQPTEAFGGNVGLVIPYLNMGEQFRTDEHGNTLGTFSSYDFALAAIYGGQISKNMLAGISMKVIRSNLSSVGAGIEKGKGIGTSFAVDVGFLYHITRKLNFGLSLRNMGPEIAYIDASQADPLPQNLMFGVAYKVLESQYNDLLLALDLYKPLITDSTFLKSLLTAWGDDALADEIKEMDLHVGGEYQYGLSRTPGGAFIALRAGYSMDRDGELNTPTFGFGLKYSLIQIDVAYISGGDTPQQDSTRFSMNLNF